MQAKFNISRGTQISSSSTSHLKSSASGSTSSANFFDHPISTSSPWLLISNAISATCGLGHAFAGHPIGPGRPGAIEFFRSSNLASAVCSPRHNCPTPPSIPIIYSIYICFILCHLLVSSPLRSETRLPYVHQTS